MKKTLLDVSLYKEKEGGFMTDWQRKVAIIVGLFGLCFLFLWFASLLYTDDEKGKKDTNNQTEDVVNKDSIILVVTND